MTGGMDAAGLEDKAMEKLTHATRLGESSGTLLYHEQLQSTPI